MYNVTAHAWSFSAEVQQAFTFLILEHGFRVTTAGATLVVYESPVVFVNVYQGRGSHEIGLELGLLNEKDKLDSTFHLMELVCLQDDEACRQFHVYQTTDPALVKKAVESLAATLKQHGNNALRGVPAVFTALHQARIQARQNYARALRESQARERGNDAWKQRNYGEVASQFGRIESALFPSEAGKLRYARKMLAKREHL